MPANPFAGGGTEQNIDKNKALMNDLIAQEGQAARQIYERQGSDAQALLAQRLAGPEGQFAPDARKAVYDAFVRDAQAAEGQQKRTMERMGALNNIFMDQAKAAVPIHAKEVDANMEAMRLQFEERRRREEEAAAAQREARASQRRSEYANSYEGRLKAALEGAQIDREVTKSMLGQTPKTEWTPKDADAMGTRGAVLDIGKLAREQSIPAQYINSANGKRYIQNIRAIMDGMIQENLPFSQAASMLRMAIETDMADVKAGARPGGTPVQSELGDWETFGKLVLASYAPQYGASWDEVLGGDYFGSNRQTQQRQGQLNRQRPAPRQPGRSARTWGRIPGQR